VVCHHPLIAVLDGNPDTEIVLKEQADLWAMSHGFSDADEMKQWGEQMERDRLAGFDLKIMPSLNKPLTMELARCDYVDRRENIIALGPSGTGKTYIALGLGLAACQRGLKVRFTTAAALVHDLIEAQVQAPE